MSNFFHAHVHSENSVLDGISSVSRMVDRAARWNHPAMALTDHGNMSGAVELYKKCREHGILPFPGIEHYLVPNHGGTWNGTTKRYHIGILALTFRGYKALVRMSSLSHTRPRFNRMPRVDLDDLAVLSGEAGRGGIAILTGCYFGWFQQSLVMDGPTKARRVLEAYSRIFPGHTYVEVQHHHTDSHANGYDDDRLVKEVYGLAAAVGLPVVITQDTHYLTLKDKKAHNLMKRIGYQSGEDAGFPGDSYHLASESFVKSHYTGRQWAKGVQGMERLLESHKLKIPALEKFQTHVPSLVPNPDVYIRAACEKKLARLVLFDKLADGHTVKEYRDRLAYELGVIKELKFAGYFTLVRKVVRWCEDHDIFVEARGSSNGSLVCYLLGITQIDPLRWGTMFERFLSPDRVKPPDIDLDIEDDRRQDVLDYIASHFPVMQIGTYQKLGIREDGKGSVLVTYLAQLRKDLGKAEFKARQYYDIKTVEDVKFYRPKDYSALKLLSGMEVRKSVGVHAAGLLISAKDIDVEDYVPTMLVPRSESTVTQYRGDDLEEFGFCKMDVLGQTVLRIMRHCQELMGRKYPRRFEWIPWDDPDTMRTFRLAHQDMGVFHFELYALANGTGVLTPTGWVPIESLDIGDDVIDPDGGKAVVQGVYPQGNKQLYKLTLNNGASVECTDDHLWNYYYNNEDVRTGTTRELRRLLDDTTIIPHIIGFESSDFGDERAILPVDPYVLGLLIGDGCLSNPSVIRFSTADEILVDSITAAYPSLIAKKDIGYGWWFRPSIKRGPNPLRDGLKSLDLLGKRAHEKYIPYEYLWSSVSTRLSVLQGLLDTDGSVNKVQGSICFTTISEQLADDVVFLVKSLGGSCSQVRRVERGTMKFFNGVASRTFPIYIVSSIRTPQMPVRLSRKVAMVKPTQRKSGRSVAKIVPSRIGPATCIKVSSKSECFIVEDWIVTHNTKSRGVKAMRPHTTQDIILAMALFMPGAMDSGETDKYLERRHWRGKEEIKYLHPAFEKALAWTYGCVIFQEQVIEIMRGLGMSMKAINVFFKVVKDSASGSVGRNEERLRAVREEFNQVCRSAGIEDVEEAWAYTAGFLAYGFNGSHAAGYGVRAYRCGYLKTHYPTEYMCALLGAAGSADDETRYVREARRMGLGLIEPDVNYSEVKWSIDPGTTGVIRSGLSSIKGVGVKAAENIVQHAPYRNLAELHSKTDNRAVNGFSDWAKTGRLEDLKGVARVLMEAGALKSLGVRSW